MALAIEKAQVRRISAANFLETAVVIDASRDPVASRRFDELIETSELRVEAVTFDQARIARDATAQRLRWPSAAADERTYHWFSL